MRNNKPATQAKLGECCVCARDATVDEIVLLCETHAGAFASREQRLSLGHIVATERVAGVLEEILLEMRQAHEPPAALVPTRGARPQTVNGDRENG